ncbi:hypothetical protein M422DRAFT_202242 [Sphaerobolus stellatus SS14]|nr:hypothetical protein M422DRAFT_202242 [Sphaerobolus stellatus SS14]
MTTKTRQRNNNAFTNTNLDSPSDLPPNRTGKITAKHKVRLPGYNVKFSTFIYLLSALAFVFIGWNTYRIFQWKSAAGGWWNLALGRTVPTTGESNGNPGYDPDSTWKRNFNKEADRVSVEDHIQALAAALGMPSKELATAIAEAVKNYVPPASLSSISAAEATSTGEAVKVLVGENDEPEPGTGLKDKISAFSSFDDPVIEDNI